MTWAVWCVASLVEWCLPLLILRTSLKKTTSLCLGEYFIKIPKSSLCLWKYSNKKVKCYFVGHLYICRTGDNLIVSGNWPVVPTEGRWRESIFQSCPWWFPSAKLCIRTPRCPSLRSLALPQLLPGWERNSSERVMEAVNKVFSSKSGWEAQFKT